MNKFITAYIPKWILSQLEYGKEHPREMTALISSSPCNSIFEAVKVEIKIVENSSGKL